MLPLTHSDNFLFNHQAVNRILIVPTTPNVVLIELADADKGSNPKEPCVLMSTNVKNNPISVAHLQPVLILREVTSVSVNHP